MSRGRFSVARRLRAWSWLALLCAWLVIAPESSLAQQAGDAPGRACTAKDLVGSWSMQAMVVAPTEAVDRGNAWFFEHQRFVFYRLFTSPSRNPLARCAGRLSSFGASGFVFALRMI